MSVIPLHPWDRRPRETAQAHQALLFYLFLGPDRTLAKAYTLWRMGGKPEDAQGNAALLARAERIAPATSCWEQWSTKWEWQPRCAAYDAYMANQVQRERESVLARQAEEWVARETEERQREWEVAGLLVKKAKAMIDAPLYLLRVVKKEEQTQDGRTIIQHVEEWHPTKWGPRDAALMVDVAARLARLATGQETERPGATPPAESESGEARRAAASIQVRLASAVQIATPAQRDILIGVYERWASAARELEDRLTEIEAVAQVAGRTPQLPSPRR